LRIFIRLHSKSILLEVVIASKQRRDSYLYAASPLGKDGQGNRGTGKQNQKSGDPLDPSIASAGTKREVYGGAEPLVK
jgi:hypothetical protein